MSLLSKCPYCDNAITKSHKMCKKCEEERRNKLNLKNDLIESRFDILCFETYQEEKERRVRQKKERERRLQEIEDEDVCEYCHGERIGYKDDLQWVGAMTAYYWDIDKEPFSDPNRKLLLCSDCDKEYVCHWQERWGDYYSGCLG